MAAYAAAGVADCNPSRCGYKAFALSICGLLLPYFFIFNPVLLGSGAPLAIITAFISAVIGVYGVACSMQGYIWSAPINIPARIAMFTASLLLVDSNLITDVIGLGIVIAIHLFFNLRRNKAKTPVVPSV